MTKLISVLLALTLLCLIPIVDGHSSIRKKKIYEDETYVIYQLGKKFWMEIGNPKASKVAPVLYYPVNEHTTTWRRITKTKKGNFDADIFFRDLPPPFGLLLPSDVIYINKIIYYPDNKASVTIFNGHPIYFLRALLKRVKNV